jgi:apolipoprotein N-acyltransferase
MTIPLRRSLAGPATSLAIALLFVLAFRWPAPSGLGFHEVLLALALPAFLFTRLARGSGLGWIGLGLFLGLAGQFTWMPGTLERMGGLPYPLALLGAGLFCAWEALGLTLVAGIARWLLARRGLLPAALGAALALLLWERYGYHIYPWSWGVAFGGLPLLARSAAFLGTHGLAALVWAVGVWAGQLPWRRAWLPPLGALALIGTLGLAWHLLPRGMARSLDVVMVQPNFEPGLRRPGMEAENWAQSEPALMGLPRPGVATLLLWPESAVLGRDDTGPSPSLGEEARRRGIAWLFGTEGPRLNLVRGEAAGRPPFLQAKVEPMPFGERMPGPAVLRDWLDAKLQISSQLPGELGPASSFSVPTPQGELKVHPLICSEALMGHRVLAGLALAGGDLLTNHTNDGWFGDSIATDVHAAQVRLRATETGLPLLRTTLSGRSGIFRGDGTWELWDRPLTRATYRFTIAWRPVSTPYRSAAWRLTLTVLLALATLGALLLTRSAPKEGTGDST